MLGSSVGTRDILPLTLRQRRLSVRRRNGSVDQGQADHARSRGEFFSRCRAVETRIPARAR